MNRRFLKDPNAVLDYVLDWSRWLDGDTVETATWIVPPGLALVRSTNTSTTTTVWLSGGTAGQKYTVTCRITTAAGRAEDRSIDIQVEDR